jgi:SAM-dependent methyltransferase
MSDRAADASGATGGVEADEEPTADADASTDGPTADCDWPTIDWDAFWRAPLTPADRDAMCRRGHDAARLLGDLFVECEVPDTVASVGCGAAVVLLDLAEEFPDTAFHGYDPAPAALERARANRDGRAASDGPLAPDRDIADVTFAAASLPDPAIDRTFDVVYCLNTLDYVPDIERALRDLFDLVADGGLLVFNYPSPARQAWYETHLANPGDYWLGEHDERWLRRRLRLVDAGENVLTREQVAGLLGHEPRPVGAFLEGVTPNPDPVVPVLAVEK